MKTDFTLPTAEVENLLDKIKEQLSQLNSTHLSPFPTWGRLKIFSHIYLFSLKRRFDEVLRWHLMQSSSFIRAWDRPQWISNYYYLLALNHFILITMHLHILLFDPLSILSFFIVIKRVNSEPYGLCLWSLFINPSLTCIPIKGYH